MNYQSKNITFPTKDEFAVLDTLLSEKHQHGDNNIITNLQYTKIFIFTCDLRF